MLLFLEIIPLGSARDAHVCLFGSLTRACSLARRHAWSTQTRCWRTFSCLRSLADQSSSRLRALSEGEIADKFEDDVIEETDKHLERNCMRNPTVSVVMSLQCLWHLRQSSANAEPLAPHLKEGRNVGA